MTKFLLDSGNPDEYREIIDLAKNTDYKVWGATTNPSLIAKKLEGRKATPQEAYELQKQIVMEIINLVPGGVSAEVYANEQTSGENMAEQGLEIANWHKRIVVKLPTTFEGFKARTILRKNKVLTNNTLVFSQEQIFAICLHEKLIQEEFGPFKSNWQPFISPFVGRLDDIGINGMDLVASGMKIKNLFESDLTWMLEASTRRIEHLKKGIEINSELITLPAKLYREWLKAPNQAQNILDANSYVKDLKSIEYWHPSQELNEVKSIDEFINVLKSGKLNIKYELTDKGLMRFTQDWQSILLP